MTFETRTAIRIRQAELVKREAHALCNTPALINPLRKEREMDDSLYEKIEDRDKSWKKESSNRNTKGFKVKSDL